MATQAPPGMSVVVTATLDANGEPSAGGGIAVPVAVPVGTIVPMALFNTTTGLPVPGFGGSVFTETTYDDSGPSATSTATVAVAGTTGSHMSTTPSGPGELLDKFPKADGYGAILANLTLSAAQGLGFQAATKVDIKVSISNGDLNASGTYATVWILDYLLPAGDPSVELFNETVEVWGGAGTSTDLKIWVDITSDTPIAVAQLDVVATVMPLQSSRTYVQ